MFTVVQRFFCLCVGLHLTTYAAAFPDRPVIYDAETGRYFPISDLSLQMDPALVLPDPEEYSPEYLESLLKHCDDPIPGVIGFIQKTWVGFREFGLKWSRYPVSFPIFRRVWLAIRPIQLFHAFILALFLSVLRYTVQKYFLNFVHVNLGIPISRAQRFIESCWKAFWFLVMWLCSFHVLILSGRTDFQYPLRILRGLRFEVGYFDIPTPTDFYCLYTLQLGFYMHSLWSVICIDAWRKDSAVLIIHHFMTLMLLELSLVLRLHRVGTLVVFLHDLNDVFMETAKANVYIQVRHGQTCTINTKLANGFFTAFALSWIVMRLYWFPLKVLYLASWGLYITNLGREYRSYLLFNTMLWALFLLHIYWFRFISIMAVRLLFQPLSDDVREEELDNADPDEYRETNGVKQQPNGVMKVAHCSGTNCKLPNGVVDGLSK